MTTPQTTQPTSVPKGMFGDMGSTNWYSPTTNLQQWQGRQYDTSGIAQGANQLSNIHLKQTPQYNPYQFQTPQAQNIGSYGQTSPEQYQNLYSASMKNNEDAIRKQGGEAMRGLGQGFEGGRMTGGAARELALKNAQNTGAAVQSSAAGLNQNMMQNQINEGQTARQNEWQQKADVAKQMFNAEQQKQLQQANENYQSAGFNANQAQNYSAEQLQLANALINQGIAVPQFQAGLNTAGIQPFMGMFNDLQQQASTAAQAPKQAADKRDKTY